VGGVTEHALANHIKNIKKQSNDRLPHHVLFNQTDYISSFRLACDIICSSLYTIPWQLNANSGGTLATFTQQLDCVQQWLSNPNTLPPESNQELLKFVIPPLTISSAMGNNGHNVEDRIIPLESFEAKCAER
jgi:hypothetical protein